MEEGERGKGRREREGKERGRGRITKPHLCITEQEYNRIIIKTSFLHAILNVLPPFSYTIVLRQLNLEALILSPKISQEKHAMHNT